MTSNSSEQVGAGVGGISVSWGGQGHWLRLLCDGDGCRQVTSCRAGGFGSGGVRNATDTGGIDRSDSFRTAETTRPLIQHHIPEDLNPSPHIHFLPSGISLLITDFKFSLSAAYRRWCPQPWSIQFFVC